MDKKTAAKIDLLLKATARTIALSAYALPRGPRRVFSLAYLLCRAADSVADTDLAPEEERLALIQSYPAAIENNDRSAIARIIGAVSAGQKTGAERALVEELQTCVTLLQELEEADRKLIYTVVRKVCEGMESDLKVFKGGSREKPKFLQTAAELDAYCAYMGGAPGVFWSGLILKYCKNTARAAEFVSEGEKIGKALQITNILRDAADDYDMGRVYLPIEDLRAAGVKGEASFDSLKKVKNKWVNYGLDNLAGAADYIKRINKSEVRMRAAVLWPVLWVLDTFALFGAAPDFSSKRVRIKIPKRNIYLTMLKTPFIIFSNRKIAKLINKKIEAVKKIK